MVVDGTAENARLFDLLSEELRNKKKAKRAKKVKVELRSIIFFAVVMIILKRKLSNKIALNNTTFYSLFL